MMARDVRWSALLLPAACLLLLVQELVATGGIATPPIPGAASRDADAGGVATWAGPRTIPPVALSSHDPAGRRLHVDVVSVSLRPGARTRLVAGPDALEPGAVLIDVCLPADAPSRTLWLGVPTWR